MTKLRRFKEVVGEASFVKKDKIYTNLSKTMHSQFNIDKLSKNKATRLKRVA